MVSYGLKLWVFLDFRPNQTPLSPCCDFRCGLINNFIFGKRHQKVILRGVLTLLVLKTPLTTLKWPVYAKIADFLLFSIEIYREMGQKHVCRFPDMFPRVPQPETAYLAPFYHPNDMVRKWRGVNLFNIKYIF